jgi:hypothetical protein
MTCQQNHLSANSDLSAKSYLSAMLTGHFLTRKARYSEGFNCKNMAPRGLQAPFDHKAGAARIFFAAEAR